MIRLGVIQAGFGNSSTVINMLRIIGAEAFEVSNPDQIADFSHLILPGVGNWSAAIKMLEDGEWTFPIKNTFEAGKLRLKALKKSKKTGTEDKLVGEERSPFARHSQIILT